MKLKMNKTTEYIIGNTAGDVEAEGYLLFQLVLSLNNGNVGDAESRPEIAKQQLKKIDELGYSLKGIYNNTKEVIENKVSLL